MAPLLPSTRLVVCPSCAEHIKASEAQCPHCGAQRSRAEAVSAAATAVLMSLTLAGCTGGASRPEEVKKGAVPTPPPVQIDSKTAPEPAYGVAIPQPDPKFAPPPGPEPEYGVAIPPDPSPGGMEPEYGVPIGPGDEPKVEPIEPKKEEVKKEETKKVKPKPR